MFAIIMIPVFVRLYFLSCIPKFGVPATAKAPVSLLVVETLQDSLLARALQNNCSIFQNNADYKSNAHRR